MLSAAPLVSYSECHATSHAMYRATHTQLSAPCQDALLTLVGLTRMLHDAPSVQRLRPQLAACRQLALQALWHLQQLSSDVQHTLVHSLVRLLHPLFPLSLHLVVLSPILQPPLRCIKLGATLA
jgi:hypothetical protein